MRKGAVRDAGRLGQWAQMGRRVKNAERDRIWEKIGGE
jgi:hypothetical protein